MYRVAITGGIGSGKSTVCELLSRRGVACYNSDSRAKWLMESSLPLREKLIARFGDTVYCQGGLNRAYLAERVFRCEAELRALNAIVHPAVMEDFEAWAQQQEGDYVVLESAILFEAGLEGYVDAVVSVVAPQELRIERAMLRDGASREDVARRVASQLSDDERRRRSRYTIENIELDTLPSAVETLHQQLVYDSQSHRP